MAIHVAVKSYPTSNIRSYFPDKEYIKRMLTCYGFALSIQDGIIFQERNPDSLSGIVTFDDAISRSIARRIGWFGAQIIQGIGKSHFRKRFVTGRFVSNFQMDIEFRDVDAEVSINWSIILLVFRDRVKIVAE